MKSKLSAVVHLEGTGLPPIHVARVTEIRTDKQMIVFEQMEGGEWRLTYSAATIPDISKLKAIVFEREPPR